MRFLIGLVGGCIIGIWAESELEKMCLKRAYPDDWFEIRSSIGVESSMLGNEIGLHIHDKLASLVK